MNALMGFDFEGVEVRVVMRDGEPWFVAADVCAVLELGNTSQALARLDDDERTLISTEGASNGLPVNAVNEPGLYTLVLGSRKPEAKAFKRWVTHEVLPTIRKTGSYSLRPATKPATETEALLMAIQNLQQTVQILHNQGKQIERITDNVTTLEHRMDSLDTANIEGDLRQRFEKMVSRYAWATGIKYPEAWKRFDQAYNTAFRANLTALRHNFAERHGLRSVTRPEYFERVGQLPDAIRIADKMLASVKREGA